MRGWDDHVIHRGSVGTMSRWGFTKGTSVLDETSNQNSPRIDAKNLLGNIDTLVPCNKSQNIFCTFC